MAEKRMKQDKYTLIGSGQIELLEKLCNTSGVTGDEGAVRKIVKQEIESIVDEMRIDSIGNLLVQKKAKKKNALKVLVAAHMDEVGFMIVDDGDDGAYRFDVVGGIDARNIPGKAVWVGKDQVPAVIGTKPPHFSSDEESSQPFKVESLRIDAGLENSKKIKKGDRAVFATRFQRLGDSLLAKAFDDRIGVATLIELVKQAPNNIDLMAAFTVQEEIGLRGAKVAAYAMQPDIAIALDSTPANDMPMWDGSENTTYNTRLGEGPAIYMADRMTLSDPRLVRHFVDTAEKTDIPYQIRQPGGGGTDAGLMHLQREGIPAMSISIPGRYAHTARMLVRISDWENTLRLLKQALSSISNAILKQER